MKRNLFLFLTVVMMLTVMTMGLLNIMANAADSAIVEYTITYHLDGGTNALKNPEVYTYEDIITLKDATKEGYDFAGWFLDSTKTEQIFEISGRTGNLNLYAKFTPKSYTATFKDGVTLTLKVSGKDDKEIYVPYGTTIDPYSKEFMSEHISSLYSSYYTECSAHDPYFFGMVCCR